MKRKFSKNNKNRKKKRSVVNRIDVEKKKTIPFIIALVSKVLDALNFVEFINEHVEWDKNQCKLSPGIRAKAFVLATFFETRMPLSQITKRYENIDTEYLFGKGVKPEDLNDDTLGRLLDKVDKTSSGKLYTMLALTAYTVYNIECRRLHSDTTTISFYGDYSVEEIEQALSDEGILKIVKGYNKDNRPGCNQVVVGKIVNEHGVPIFNEVMDGNTSDVEWNQKALGMVSAVFANELENMIYVADAKLMTEKNYLLLMNPEKTIQFVSRVPANFNSKLSEKVTKMAYEKGEWVYLGTVSDRVNASEYQSQEFTMEVYDYYVRCIVYKSSDGTNNFEKKKKKEEEDLKSAIKKAKKKEFSCEKDAQKEAKYFQKEHKNSIYDYKIEVIRTDKEKRRRGNPGKNPKPPEIVSTWYLNIEVIGENHELMKKLKMKEESFVLMSNVDASSNDSKQTLGTYKNQSLVEIQFRLLKEPCIASVIFLDTPGRIRAMLMLLGISLLIRSIIQYELRKGYRETEKELPKVGWNGAKLKPNITIFFLIRAIMNNEFVREDNGYYSYAFTNEFNERQITTLFDLMGMIVEDLID